MPSSSQNPQEYSKHDYRGEPPSPGNVMLPLPQRWRVEPWSLPLPPPAQRSVSLPKGMEPSGMRLDFAWALGDCVSAPSGWAYGPADSNAWLRVELGAQDLPDQGYRLQVQADHVLLEGAQAISLFYGALSLRQWIEAHEKGNSANRITDAHSQLGGLWLEDFPHLPRRGFMLDISRDRVPKVAELEQHIDRIARLKGNHLEWYMEHSFAYAGHEEVHRNASPLTAEEVRHLVAYATRRGIECVPNQNTFGHMHRWLSHPRYQPLAEEPIGDFHAFDHVPEPFSLCPSDPGSLELVQDLLAQLLPCFTSPLFQAGLDETLDLGRGRSMEACVDQGVGAVYLQYLQRIAALAREHDKRLVFWADILLEHPEAIEQVPKDSIAVLWGYEADHPFEEQAERLQAAGVEFWIAPGTATWQCLTGRWENAQINIRRAVDCAQRFGASGLVLTEWGDYGHWQSDWLCEPERLLFFGLAWNREFAPPMSCSSDAFAGWIDRSLFDGHAPQLANVLMRLVQANQELQDGARNGSGPFFCMRYPPHGPNRKERWQDRAPTWNAAGAENYREVLLAMRAELDACKEPFPKVIGELRLSIDLALWATSLAETRVVGISASPEQAQAFAEILVRYANNWQQRSRPGGLQDSLRKLKHALSSEEWAQLA